MANARCMTTNPVMEERTLKSALLRLNIESCQPRRGNFRRHAAEGLVPGQLDQTDTVILGSDEEQGIGTVIGLDHGASMLGGRLHGAFVDNRRVGFARGVFRHDDTVGTELGACREEQSVNSPFTRGVGDAGI